MESLRHRKTQLTPAEKTKGRKYMLLDSRTRTSDNGRQVHRVKYTPVLDFGKVTRTIDFPFND